MSAPVLETTAEQTNGTEYALGPLDQIPLGEGREFNVAGNVIAVFRLRRGAGVYATQATCPHRNGPLIDGLVGGMTVVCPFHAWKFDLRTGEAIMGSCGITTYPVRITESGDLVLNLTDLPSVPGDACEAAPGFNVFSKENTGDGRPLPASGA